MPGRSGIDAVDDPLIPSPIAVGLEAENDMTDLDLAADGSAEHTAAGAETVVLPKLRSYQARAGSGLPQP